MPRTTDFPQVQPRDIQPVAHGITERLLKNRKLSLPRAQNGRPAPVSTPQAAQLRKHMQQGLSTPVRQLLTVLADDIRCGVPLSVACAPLNEMLAFLELEADAVKPRPEDFVTLFRAETRAQGRLDLAQIKVQAEPNAPEVLDELVTAHAQYRAASDSLIRNAMARLAVLRGSCANAFSVARR